MTAAAVVRARAAPVPDIRFMEGAIALGRRMMGRTWPNPAVGALIVRHELHGPVIVGRGWTRAGGRPHAETEALRRAGEAARGATLYVTLEPCSHHGQTPPCADAIIAAGISRVVYAVGDPNPLVAGAGHARLRAAGIAVDVGLGATEARRSLAGHLCRMRHARPHVMLKLAVSADGKIGLAGRRPVAITGPEIQARVHLLRAASDAVMIGSGTALADDPQLTCRLPGMADRSPVRIVLDRELRVPLTSKLVQTIGTAPVWLVASTDASREREAALRERGVQILRAETGPGGLSLPRVLALLAARGMTRLMVEGGARLAAALVAADLVDEFVVSRAPKLLGPDGVDAIEGLPLSILTHSPRFASRGVEALGEDTIETFDRVD
ncbi:MAG TPA: bifunctional diaminohydroxyphosphoribosylaminopyrimidine deaminase/5-amino-6-(5-phosphoribosylamino)uracil reductase RibD [Xanthobacteraceae bacterium]|nr:bifunctional diaminohydroxyphosphoribosylaminopyrimidine deaminase/5-amino-6-(5-phosphoribosylamino)uracil reductase RibD [Xanthobacteraceae bacterium]